MPLFQESEGRIQSQEAHYYRSTLLTVAADYLMQVCNDTACLPLRNQQT
jgi:hypothetical protein